MLREIELGPEQVAVMSIFHDYLIGLAVAHLAWFYFFVTGQLLRRPVSKEGEPFSLIDVVTTSASGMALAGFALVFLGFAHLLNLFGICAILVLEGVLFWKLRGDNWLSGRFWTDTFQRLGHAWSVPALFVYLVLLAVGLPAVLPPIGGDAATYHLAYALEWAQAGRIHVDPFLRFPYYANNFLPLYSAFFVLKLGHYCQFLTWLCGLLTCLGVLAFFTSDEIAPDQRAFSWKRSWPHEFLVPLAIALSPIFLHYLNVGMLDVPIGLFVLVPILCVYRSSSWRPLEREFVATAAFCVGMKLTLIGHLPFFLGSLFFAVYNRLPWRKIALLCIAFVGLSLPWYVRNWIETHDPVPPVFNFYLNRPDPIFTQADTGIYVGGAMTPRDPLHLVLLPFRFFTDATSRNFRELGINALIFLLYAPLFLLIAQFFWRRRRRATRPLIYLSIAVVYLVFPWLFSSLGRHALHWYPALAAWVGVVISNFCVVREEPTIARRVPVWMRPAAAVALSLLLIYPSPTKSCMRFYRNYYAGTIPVFSSRDRLKSYAKQHVHGYMEGQAVIATLTLNRKKSSRVLVLGRETPAFYFRKANIKSVGDYFGPAEYRELFAEVAHGNCLPYLNRLRIAAIIIEPRISTHWGSRYTKFRLELEQAGFVEYRCGGDEVPIFLRSDITPSRKLTRVKHDPPLLQDVRRLSHYPQV